MFIRPEDAASWKKKKEEKVKTLGKAGSKSLEVILNFLTARLREKSLILQGKQKKGRGIKIPITPPQAFGDLQERNNPRF